MHGRWPALCVAACLACDPPAPQPLGPDAATADAALDTTPDMSLIDAAQPDMRGPRDMAARDMAARDMAARDMAARDMAARDMAARDMAADAAPPDMHMISDGAPPDMAPDMRAPDLGPAPERACFDEIDNDEDGRVDCADPDCRPLGACFDHPEDCENGVDDNGDNWADCEDVLCLDVCPRAGDPPLDAAAIQARFDQVCTQCHAGAQPAAQLDLTAFEQTTINVRSTQVDGLRVAPGDRQASYLWRKMAYSYRTFPGGGGEGMPPVDAQEASFVDRFGDWIDGL